MGLFGSSEKKQCAFCDRIGGFGMATLADGNFICADCQKKLVVSPNNKITKEQLINMTSDDIKQRYNYVRSYLETNKDRVSAFVPTYKIGNYIWFDDDHKWFVLPTGTFSPKIDESNVFEYSDIIGFEAIEDGETITKGGLGKAIVGGALFGVVGAIAGGTSKKTKSTCTLMQVKITTRNKEYPLIYVDLIKGAEYKRKGMIYKASLNQLQEILSKFKIILDELENSSNAIQDNDERLLPTDEIRRYKQLLNEGIITSDEFDKKKKELLGL